MDVTFREDQPFLPVSRLQGKNVSEEFNRPLEIASSTLATLPDFDPHPMILPINQVTWKTYYRSRSQKGNWVSY